MCISVQVTVRYEICDKCRKKEQVEKVREWLSKLAANVKEFQSLKILEHGRFETLDSTRGEIHLYKTREIAELLGIEYQVEPFRCRGQIRPEIEVSFYYDGIRFFGLEDIDAEQALA